jgi:hypothetical protein
MRISSPFPNLVRTLRWMTFIGYDQVLGRQWVLEEMSMTSVFTAHGAIGDFDKSIEYLFPEFAGRVCPIDIHGDRLLERSPFIHWEDEDIVLRRRSAESSTEFDLSLLYIRGTWFLEFDETAGLGDPNDFVKPPLPGHWSQV